MRNRRHKWIRRIGEVLLTLNGLGQLLGGLADWLRS